MWDLSSQVRWWEESQLRILVLGSLFLQFVLFFGSLTRHVRALKSCMWLAYISADAVAIYALSTLFNRHKLPSTGGGGGGGGGDATSSSPLEILWAPVLLLHLGGQHTFMAYSIEDNELWGRHVVTLVSQVTVAVYVFCKSWSGGDKRLLQAAILLFVAGILNFALKPLALRAASFHSAMTSLAAYPQRRAQRPTICMVIRMVLLGSCATISSFADAFRLRDEEDHDLSLDEYVKQARQLALATEVDPKHEFQQNFFRLAVKQFVDLSDPYSRRLRDMLTSHLKLDHQGVITALDQRIGFSFAMIYTGLKTSVSFPGLLLKLLLPSITLSSSVLFGQSHNDGYQEKDVRVTYVLLWCSTLLALLSVMVSPCFCGVMIWSISASQHNLLSFAARRRKPTVLMNLSAVIGFSDYINKHWYVTLESSRTLFIKPPPPPPPGVQGTNKSTSIEVIGLVFEHLKDGWKRYIVDGASYRGFNNLRGQWAMCRHKVNDPRLLWILHVQFDHSVLVWHVATELCAYHWRTSLPEEASVQESAARRHSRLLSNYMIYLLFVRPDMLLPGTRQELFTNTSDDIEVMLKHAHWLPVPDGTSVGVAQQILRAAKSPSLNTTRLGPWILKACKLAEDLMELLGDEERWLLIRDVWVEMICYSAGRCRGYLHAKSMGEGVEFLTYVWLLLSGMGMETFADKFQRPDPTQGKETEMNIDAGDSSASQAQDRAVAEAITIPES